MSRQQASLARPQADPSSLLRSTDKPATRRGPAAASRRSALACCCKSPTWSLVVCICQPQCCSGPRASTADAEPDLSPQHSHHQESGGPLVAPAASQPTSQLIQASASAPSVRFSGRQAARFARPAAPYAVVSGQPCRSKQVSRCIGSISVLNAKMHFSPQRWCMFKKGCSEPLTGSLF